MNRPTLFALAISLSTCIACSPRDFLTRRLANDLIASSSIFKAPQTVTVRTGIMSNQDYLSSEFLTFRRHGWTSATQAPCPAGITPPPCWNVVLTPSGIDTVRILIGPQEADKISFAIPAAKRELLAITGITKQGPLAEVEFTWRWMPLNEVGAAFFSGEVQYKSVTAFREYDDGWRVVEAPPQPSQSLIDALKNAEPMR